MNRIMSKYSRVLAAFVMAIVTAGVAVAQQASLIGTLDGHTDPVYAVAWSPDGKTLATAGFDNTVRLWDAATRKEIKKYEGHSKLVLSCRRFARWQTHPLGKPGQHCQDLGLPDIGPVENVRRASSRVAGACSEARWQAIRRGVGQVSEGLGPDHRQAASRTSKDTRAMS